MRPVHPGEVLREDYLREIGQTAEAMARELGLPLESLVPVLEERAPLTPALAERFVAVYGGDVPSWLVLQARYDEQHDRRTSHG